MCIRESLTFTFLPPLERVYMCDRERLDAVIGASLKRVTTFDGLPHF